ncbi:MAG: DUF4214 domain-containing protein [Epsilonproteobacteria bacterium]|nr:DUF4214 domain-containing protein [Campylobacterota bacterium]
MKRFMIGFILLISFISPISLSASDAEIEGFVKRLYKNVFEREADSSGLFYWKNRLKNGDSAVSVARSFFISKEFKNLNLSDEEFIKRNYNTFFDREPDSEGEKYWLREMQEEGLPKMQVFYGFALSKEFGDVCKKYGISQVSSDDKLRAFIERFYNYILKRDAGESEIDYWFNALKDGSKSSKDIVKFFFFSNEFKSQNVSDEEFVKRVYRTIMGRVADEEGFDFWVGELKKGKSREYVLNSFLESEEFERLKSEFMTPSGNAIYVSINGSDSNPGTESSPFKTIQKAVNSAKPGDTIYLRGGVYVGRVYIHKSGEKGKYITIRNYPGEVPVITRNDKDFYKQTILLDGVSYMKIIGLKIDKTTSNAIRVQGPGEYIEFKYNEVSYQNEKIPENERIGKAVVFAGYKDKPLRHILIEGNKIHNNHTGRKGIESESLTVYGKVEYFKIINNKVYDNDFIGIDIIGKDTGSYAHLGTPRYGLIKNNELYGNGRKNKYSSALYLDGGEDIVVENNFIHDNFGPGIAVNQEEKDSFITHVVIRNNVSYRNYYNSFGSASYGGVVRDSIFVHNTLYSTEVYDPSEVKQENLFYLGKGENNVIKNNIFYKKGGYYIMLEVVGRSNATKWEIDYDGFFPLISQMNQVIINNTIYKSIEALRKRSPHSISAPDPLLKNDFRLDPNSPCVDKGGFLTYTESGGSGKVVKVKDARYFTGRWGLERGEDIKIGGKKAVVVSADYKNKTITLDRALSWNAGEGVGYDYSGERPDIGAYELNQ